MYLLALPDDVLEKILSYISYDEVSRSRVVCQRFNEISKRVLNHGFHKVEKYHNQCLKYVKSQLPRRESERRNHPLARHSDILTAIETRLSLLSMTFKKFIDLNFCCFIPGKVLDEIFRVLRYVTSVQSPIRAHEVLQELRDLSSMAMEYFDEKIAPGLKRHKETGPRINVLCTSVKHVRPSTPTPLYKMFRYVNELAKRHNNLLSEVSALRVKKKDLESIGKRVAELEKFAAESKKKLSESEKLIAEQQITISQQSLQLFEQELKIEKLSKLVEEKPMGLITTTSNSKKFRTLRKKKFVHQIRKSVAMRKSIKRKLVTSTEEKSENSAKKLKT